MKLVLALLTVLTTSLATFAAADERAFERRVYYAAPGKLDDLHKRFRDHTCKLFEKHGMTNLGYFVPLGDNPENKLIYFLAYPSRDAAKKSWADFMADPVWKKAFAESHANGVLVAKVESTFMTATDYSPLAKALSGGDRVFEMRTYTTEPGRLDALNARFRDHTVKLFTKHGMENIAYWTPAKGDPKADNTLIYLLAHQSQDAAKASFGAFGKDPDWQAARKASEEKAGGSLTVKGGVQSLFLKPTDYSAVK